MTKFQLEVEYEYDFDLIGISCHARDYRLCWALNNQFGINLNKDKIDYDLKTKKQKETNHHSLYRYVNEEDHVEYILLLNKSGSSVILPEQKSADFLFILKNNFSIEVDELLQELKKIDLIQTAFKIDIDALKSKENLIF